jgi:hypothetical protein
MSPKPPRAIRVGPLVYTVSEDRTQLLEAVRAEQSGLLGITDHSAATITLDKRQAPCMKRDTLLHEVLHCLTQTTGIADELGDNEEGVVRRLAPALLGVLRDNAKLVAYLTDKGD